MHINSVVVSFEQEEEINDTEKISDFKKLMLIISLPGVNELPSTLDSSRFQSSPSIPDISQNINDSVEQLSKLFCDKSVSLKNV